MRYRLIVLCIWAVSFNGSAPPLLTPAQAANEPVDLTGKVATIVTFQARDNFSNEVRYEVTLRNLGTEPIIADSLTLVLDRVTDIGGDDREALRNEPLLKRMDVLDAEGETADGKPFFRVTVDGGRDLMPQNDSRPITVRLRNRDYVQLFTPIFRVFGSRRLPVPVLPLTPPLHAGPKAPVGKQPMDRLIQLLIKKGVLTEEEWRAANQPTP